ncbi:TPA: helix-turn-helix domain-containing protein [Pseudomonas aeruginosa]|nr:helix-turn-helix domain-containing protein [Pseudomonas aeruginosa]
MKLKPYLDQRRGAGSWLAREIDVSPVLVSQWANGVRQVPAEHCPSIERATGGLVTCEEMRPDVDWACLRQRQVPSLQAI